MLDVKNNLRVELFQLFPDAHDTIVLDILTAIFSLLINIDIPIKNHDMHIGANHSTVHIYHVYSDLVNKFGLSVVNVTL